MGDTGQTESQSCSPGGPTPRRTARVSRPHCRCPRRFSAPGSSPSSLCPGPWPPTWAVRRQAAMCRLLLTGEHACTLIRSMSPHANGRPRGFPQLLRNSGDMNDMTVCSSQIVRHIQHNFYTLGSVEQASRGFVSRATSRVRCTRAGTCAVSRVYGRTCQFFCAKKKKTTTDFRFCVDKSHSISICMS